MQLSDPNGGVTLFSGEMASIVWRVVIQHDTQNWDLWYSTSGPEGPWIPIASDLPVGNGAANSVHTFEWVVPAAPSETVRVRVRQDNGGTDYQDVSDADLTIESSAAIFASGFESGDVSDWSSSLPREPPPPRTLGSRRWREPPRKTDAARTC